MDTKTLIAEAKARFNLNSAKAQLKDKYDGKLTVADQGGLWKADLPTINFLNSTDDDEINIAYPPLLGSSIFLFNEFV